MAHATLRKFGYPETVLKEGEEWALLLRPMQVTLGSLVLCARSEATAYGDLSANAFAEQREMVALAETLLSRFIDYQRINYLMLMMVDPHVHFHIIPRYEGGREYAGIGFPDSAWPGPPNLSHSLPAPEGLTEELRRLIGVQLTE